MADVVKTGWFGRKVHILLSNGKSINGEMTEVTDHYVVVEPEAKQPTQVMVHAIMAIRPIDDEEE